MAKGPDNLIREEIVFNVQRLSRATALAGLTRRELGQRAGLSAQPVANAFAGRGLSVKSARRIAAALKVELRRLASHAAPSAAPASATRERDNAVAMTA